MTCMLVRNWVLCTSLSLLKKVSGGEVDTVIPCATGVLCAWTLSPILS